MRLVPVLVLLALAPTPAGAQCPAPQGASPQLAQRPAAERLRFLSRALDTDAANTRTWRLGWGAALAVGTLGQLAVIPLLRPEDQQDFVVGVASSAVGVASTLIGAPEVMDDAPAFATRVAAGGDECVLLAEAERLIVKDAANELSGVTWYLHAANIAFNLGLGLVIGLGFGHWVSALINFLVGAAIGEGTLFTRPTALDGAWKGYLSGTFAPPALSGVRVSPLGLGLAVQF